MKDIWDWEQVAEEQQGIRYQESGPSRWDTHCAGWLLSVLALSYSPP